MNDTKPRLVGLNHAALGVDDVEAALLAYETDLFPRSAAEAQAPASQPAVDPAL